MRTRIRITRAWSELELRGRGPALRMLEQARADAAALGDPLLTALTWIQEGTVHGRVWAYADALQALDRAEDHEDVLDPAQRWALSLNRGQAHLGLGRTADAALAFERACTIAVEHGLVDQEFKARHNLARTAFVDGDLPRALALLHEADAMETTVARDRARLDHAEVLLEAGLVDAARRTLEDARATARREGHRLEEGEISLRLALCDVLVGSLDEAREHVRQATAAYRARQAPELVAEADLIRATVDVVESHDLPTVAAELARRRHARTTGAGDVVGSDRTAARLEAEARLTLGDVDGTERVLEALGGSRDPSLAGTLHELLVRARLDVVRGRRTEAAAHLDAGNRILAAHQNRSASLDVRAAMALHGRRLADLDVERALADDTPDGVLTAVERWRAVSHRITPVTAPDDPELASLTRELRRLRQLLAEADGGAEDLAVRIAATESELTRREWSLGVEGPAAGAVQPAGADEARAAVAARDTTVVEFFELAGELHRVVVTGTGTRVSRLGDVPDVIGLVTRLRRDLRATAITAPGSPMAAALAKATSSSLEAVDRALGPPGAAPGRVVLVPSSSLAGMPWSLLPSLRGRPVTVAPSLTRWARGPARGGASSPGPVGTVPTVAALFGPGLSRTAPEIAAVLQAWAAAVPAALEPATSEAVLNALATARVVHLATHGVHEGQSPLFSSLRMADGPLFAHEFPRPVTAEHVVLSACDVGQFSTRPGDEPLGLSTALLSLGATSVLAAVAPVADDVAHDAMVAYHHLLARGVDAAQAWATVVEAEPAAGVFCVYGSDWSVPVASTGGLR